MIKLLPFVFPFFCFQNIAQVSYDFAEPLPPTGEKVITISEFYHGKYTSSSNDRIFEFNSKGLFVHTIQMHSMTRKTLRESTKYTLRNGYLLGFVENDSIPVVEQDTLIYFGLPTTEQISGPTTKNVLKQVSQNTYILNFFEKGHYVPCLISIVQGEMRFQYFDYAENTALFTSFPIKGERKENGLETITLQPTENDFSSTDFRQFFGQEVVYRR